MPLLNKPAAALALLLALTLGAAAADTEEIAAGRLFHPSNLTNEPAALVSAAKVSPTLGPGPYRAAVRSLHGWLLLRAGKTAEAKTVYEALLADPSSPAPLAEIARRWLTRLDREQVRAALTRVWAEKIQFPDSLDALTPPLPPLRDRWNQPWRYRPQALKLLKSSAQRYELQSATLGADSDLAAAIARPWPVEAPVKVTLLTGGANTVVTLQNKKSPPDKAMLTQGKSWEGVTLVHIGDRALLLAENDFVFFTLKPGA